MIRARRVQGMVAAIALGPLIGCGRELASPATTPDATTPDRAPTVRASADATAPATAAPSPPATAAATGATTAEAPPPVSATPPDDAECARDPRGWCPGAAGDPCGAHRDRDACRADPTCGGMPYRGESVISCIRDERGFGVNCPTVGCISLERPGDRRTISALKGVAAGDFTIDGFVAHAFTCPECPAGAMCKPCVGNHVVVSEDKRGEAGLYPLGGRELVVFTSTPAELQVGARYRLWIALRPGSSFGRETHDAVLRSALRLP